MSDSRVANPLPASAGAWDCAGYHYMYMLYIIYDSSVLACTLAGWSGPAGGCWLCACTLLVNIRA